MQGPYRKGPPGVRVRRLLLDPARVELRRDGESVHVEPQVFDVLAYLLAHRSRWSPRPSCSTASQASGS